MARVILVTGATGKQGGSTINALLASKEDVVIYALTRSPTSAAALALTSKSPSIKIVGGNLNTPETIFSAIPEQVWGVFSVQTPMGRGASPEIEERQGKALLDAAIKHNVKHFVFTSGDRGGKELSETTPTNVATYAAKYRIEKYIQEKTAAVPEQPMTWTILRPTCFMENFSPGVFGKVMAAIWKVSMPPDGKMQFVSASDIGYFAAQSLLHYDSPEFKNTAISLAGDEMTLVEANMICKEKTGKPLPAAFSIFGSAILHLDKELKLMFEWIANEGSAADIAECRKLNPSMMTFGEWIEKNLK